MQERTEELNIFHVQLLELLLDIAVTLVVAGAHSGKTIRIVKRFAKAYGFDVYIMLQMKSVVLTLSHSEDHGVQQTAIRHIPNFALNFYFQNMISRLSWQVHDEGMDFAVLTAKYHEIITASRYSYWFVLIAVSLANMGFCRLFGGDFWSMLFVLSGTAAAYHVRSKIQGTGINHLLVISFTAFVSSVIAGCTVLFSLGSTAPIALATSVLFLIPGVPLINSLIEILEGHILNGIEKLLHSCTVIVCIALGLLLTSVLLGLENL